MKQIECIVAVLLAACIAQEPLNSAQWSVFSGQETDHRSPITDHYFASEALSGRAELFPENGFDEAGTIKLVESAKGVIAHSEAVETPSHKSYPWYSVEMLQLRRLIRKKLSTGYTQKKLSELIEIEGRKLGWISAAEVGLWISSYDRLYNAMEMLPPLRRERRLAGIQGGFRLRPLEFDQFLVALKRVWPEKATQAQIAEISGVSIKSISLLLQNRPTGTSAGLRAKIVAGLIYLENLARTETEYLQYADLWLRTELKEEAIIKQVQSPFHDAVRRALIMFPLPAEALMEIGLLVHNLHRVPSEYRKVVLDGQYVSSDSPLAQTRYPVDRRPKRDGPRPRIVILNQLAEPVGLDNLKEYLSGKPLTVAELCLSGVLEFEDMSARMSNIAVNTVAQHVDKAIRDLRAFQRDENSPLDRLGA